MKKLNQTLIYIVLCVCIFNVRTIQARDAYVPTTGDVRIPILLVEFKDNSFTLNNPVEAVNQLFNTNGGTNPSAKGSVHTYYYETSAGQLNLQYDVYGPYKLSREMSYYGGNQGNSSNKNAQGLVIEAARLAEEAGVDFAQYDNDGDGFIDNVSIITAGHNEAEGASANHIWPHYSTIYNYTIISGKRLYGYLMTSELCGSNGNIQSGIGTYCHEFGHALGLPDLYNTESSKVYTVGTWDIMCSGSYNHDGCVPPTFSAYERWHMGWLTPEQLLTPGTKELEAIETSNTAYLISSGTHNLKAEDPNISEFWLLENRVKTGWDKNPDAIVGEGMLISHITWDANKWNRNTFNNQSPLGYAIEWAANDNPSRATASDLYPGTAEVTYFTPTLNDREQLQDQRLVNIFNDTEKNIYFFYGIQTDYGFQFTPSELPVLITEFYTEIYRYDIATVQINGTELTTDSVYISVSNRQFEFSVDSLQWYSLGDTLRDAISAEATYNQQLYIRHKPINKHCDTINASLMITNRDNSIINILPLKGVAPRATIIATPVLTDSTDITTTEATIRWQAVKDVERYYITCYSLENGTGTETQDFDNYTSAQDMQKDEWYTSGTLSNGAFGQGKHAIYLSQSNDTLQSCIYPDCLQKISVLLNNNLVSQTGDSPEGKLTIYVSKNGKDWSELATQYILSTTTKLTKTWDVDTAQHFNRVSFQYKHISGSGGVFIDNIACTMPHTPTYIHRGQEFFVSNKYTETTFSDLQMATTYYAQVQAYENKGCVPHYTPHSTPLAFRTKGAPTPREGLTILRMEDGSYNVLLPKESNGNETLSVFDIFGHLVWTMAIKPQCTIVTIPASALTNGNPYLVKLYEGKIHRKDASGKLIAY